MDGGSGSDDNTLLTLVGELLTVVLSTPMLTTLCISSAALIHFAMFSNHNYSYGIGIHRLYDLMSTTVEIT